MQLVQDLHRQSGGHHDELQVNKQQSSKLLGLILNVKLNFKLGPRLRLADESAEGCAACPRPTQASATGKQGTKLSLASF